MSGSAAALCAPSGTGKTTVARRLVEERNDLVFSVSATTRAPRPNEQRGVDYQFVGRAEFESMIQRGELLEWAEVHGEYYGTPRSNLEAAARDKKLLILDIDVQGARQVVQARPETVAIFLLPPSADALLERLRKRGSEDDEQVSRRLETAKDELSAMDEFEYVVVNDRLDETVRAVESIIDGKYVRTGALRAELELLRGRILEDIEAAGV